ncbi:MAG TPA: glycosyltransferase 87 family protein [Longimicrobiales bacterium]|nr:glycosyltransferase 87 family protein [Longimicrobiales bacterium]
MTEPDGAVALAAGPRGRERVVRALRAWWQAHGPRVLLLAVGCMIAAAVWRLGNELPRLLWEQGGYGAFDLRLRHREVELWFSGQPIYNDVERGDYPPASYVLLWPLLGWLPLASARLLWALTTLAALYWLARMAVRESTAVTRLQVLTVALLPFSTYATSAAIRVGQIGNHVLPLLVAGVLVLYRRRGRWRDDLLAAMLLIPTLVKPTLTAACFWIVCFVPRRLRPIALIGLGYLALTFFAIGFQDGDLRNTLLGWLSEPPQVLSGHANVQKWLAVAGLGAWTMPASLVILLLLAAWVHRHRGIDIWILLGVSALVGRLFIHHRLYDDMLVLLPMITLFRIGRQGAQPDGRDVVAGLLFAATWVTLHAPASLLASPPPLPVVMEAGQSIVWVLVLLFLLGRARHERRVQKVVEAPAP